MINGYFLRTCRPVTIYFDTSADVAELEQYAAEHELVAGSVAVDCSNGEEWLLDSLGKWHKKGGSV